MAHLSLQGMVEWSRLVIERFHVVKVNHSSPSAAPPNRRLAPLNKSEGYLAVYRNTVPCRQCNSGSPAQQRQVGPRLVSSSLSRHLPIPY
jgi:hypothetical protein